MKPYGDKAGATRKGDKDGPSDIVKGAERVRARVALAVEVLDHLDPVPDLNDLYQWECECGTDDCNDCCLRLRKIGNLALDKPRAIRAGEENATRERSEA